MQGIVDRIRREASTGSISAEDGGTFAFREDSLVDIEFESLVVGTRVEFEVDDAQGDERLAINVRPASEQISMSAVEALSPQQEVEPDVEARGPMVPPKNVEHDEVDEPSWESFPASDPPSTGRFT